MTAGAELLEGVRHRHAPSIARAITFVEAQQPGLEAFGDAIWALGGHARVTGITGAPGTGKSTLTNALVRELRSHGRTVGVVAVDPSSAISGGALLGDRIRMSEHTDDDAVFIRSLSARGKLGGVSAATADAVAVLDAAGFDDVLVETVGVGQSDVDIVKFAQCVVLVSVPGLGDDIQMIKAGLSELADVHVVNKADRPGVHKLVAEIRAMLLLTNPPCRDRPIPVIETVAITGSGIDSLANELGDHELWLRDGGEERRSARRGVEQRIREIAKELLVESIEDPARRDGFESAVSAVVARDLSPRSAARALLAEVGGRDRS